MNLDELIAKRRSVRKFEDRPVDEETLRAVLEVGRLAPSGKNEQFWFFTAVRGKAHNAAMMEACCGQRLVGEATATVVVWAKEDRQMTCGHSAAVVDCSIAASFMMLKATELGLGSCWLGAFDAEAVKQVLGLPGDAIVVTVLPMGWPAEHPPQKPRKPAARVYEIQA